MEVEGLNALLAPGACSGGASPHAPAVKLEPGSSRPPLEDWVHNMLRCQFFTPCPRHRELKKAEATYFCADCGVAPRPLCGHCALSHAGHRLLQVRRYVYCDVVRCGDMAHHLDVGGVQAYTINQAKVLFLNPRPAAKMARAGAPDACATCCRTLREGCSYCSVACKVEALTAQGRLRPPTAAAAAASDDSCDGGWPSAAHAHGGSGGSAGHAADNGSGDSGSSGHQLIAGGCWHSSSGGGSDAAAAAAAAAALAMSAAAAVAAAQQQQQQQQQFSAGDAAMQLDAAAAAAQPVDLLQLHHQYQHHQHHQHHNHYHRHVGSAAAALARRQSDDCDSDGRNSSSTTFCCRRKQASPRRSPLL